MLLELDKETIDFLCKHKLTLTQLGICLLIHKEDAATLIKINNEVRMMGDCMFKQSSGKYKSELIDLIDREFIIQINTSKDLSDPLSFDNFRLNPHFSKELIDWKQDALQELLDAYPDKLFINGTEFPSKGCNFEELEKQYFRAISNSKKKHIEILKKLAAFRERNQYALVGIEKFVGGRMWETLEESIKPRTRGY